MIRPSNRPDAARRLPALAGAGTRAPAVALTLALAVAGLLASTPARADDEASLVLRMALSLQLWRAMPAATLAHCDREDPPGAPARAEAFARWNEPRQDLQRHVDATIAQVVPRLGREDPPYDSVEHFRAMFAVDAAAPAASHAPDARHPDPACADFAAMLDALSHHEHRMGFSSWLGTLDFWVAARAYEETHAAPPEPVADGRPPIAIR